MSNNSHSIEDLIAKHFAGETSPAEEILLSKWLDESEANYYYFDSLQKIFDDSATLKEFKYLDTDAAWNKLKAKIKVQPQENSGSKIKHLNINYFLRIAAILILITGIAITIYVNLNSASKPVFASTGDFTQEIMLPDSSTIFLNKNSSVTYSYSNKQRNVVMTGEAFFEVVHNANLPFTVNAGALEIKDIGTSFNINARATDSVEVLVQTGEVLLHAAEINDVNVLQGERSVYKQANRTITKLAINDSNALSYKTKIFIFENASLFAVIQKLNEVYGTRIKLAENLNYCRLTSTFKNEKIESILQIIAETLQLRITTNNSQTVLEGNSCEE